jgi:DNA polymerase-3 subunit alpha
MDALAFLGLVKFDFLAVTTLDTLQMTIDLVKDRTGTVIDPWSWTTEYDDADVWAFLSAGNTKGCFQIETPAGTKVTKDLKPRSMHDLADVITLDRPGPMRSGLDQAYLRRRHGKEPVSYADPRLSTVLDRSYGVLLYQEDIMKSCMVLAGYDDEEADKVRKILGKKKIELAKAEGAKFINAAIERGMKPDAAEKLWNQMEEFARYSFNRAHAFGYAMVSYWCAWMKYHYPQEFYVAAMSMLDSDNKSKVVDFVSEARVRGFPVLPPDINTSKNEYTIVGNEIRYGLGSVLGIGDVAIKKIIENQPYESYQSFREQKVCNVGIIKKLIQVGAFDSFGVHRGQLLAELEREESGADLKCVDFNEHKVGAVNDLPCEFDWSAEPVRIGARGKPLKMPPIPKKCTVRCRNYRQAEPAQVDAPMWSEVDIRNAEMELLGVHLSSTPFDKANEQFGDEIFTATQIEAEGTLPQACVIGIVKQVREKLDKNQNPWAIVSLFAQDGTIDALCFNKNWKALKGTLRENALVMAVLSKDDRGYKLHDAAMAEQVMK